MSGPSSAGCDRPAMVFAARRPPFPPDNGGRIRAHRLLSGLAAALETTLVCPAITPGGVADPVDAAELCRQFPGVRVVTVAEPAQSKRKAQALSLVSRRSWSYGRHLRSGLQGAVAAEVQRCSPCVVHFDDLGAAVLGPFADAMNVYSSHNLEARILEQAATVGSAGRRLFNAVEARKVGAEERRVWRSMDLCLAVSPLDAEAMRAGGAAWVELCPNGTDDVAPVALEPLPAADPVRILFVGSGDYAPYERGLAWFVREVLPRVRARQHVAFEVVGQPPRRPVAAEGVGYVGRVPDVQPHYAKAHVIVVPVFEGAGTRLKVVEAAARGRPVVSTRLGAEGLPLRAGEHFRQADDPEAFAAAVLDVAERSRSPGGDEELRRMVAQARKAVLPLLWPNVVARLIELYTTAPGRAVLAGRGS